MTPDLDEFSDTDDADSETTDSETYVYVDDLVSVFEDPAWPPDKRNHVVGRFGGRLGRALRVLKAKEWRR